MSDLLRWSAGLQLDHLELLVLAPPALVVLVAQQARAGSPALPLHLHCVQLPLKPLKFVEKNWLIYHSPSMRENGRSSGSNTDRVLILEWTKFSGTLQDLAGLAW